MIGAFLTTILWSFSAIFARKSTGTFGPGFANFSRLFLACIFLGAYTHLFAPAMEWKSFQILFWSGVIGLGLGDLALFVALPRLGSRLSLLMVQCLAAPIAAFIEWIWLGTTLNTVQMISGLVVLTGIAIAFRPSGEVSPDALGIAMGLLAALGQGAGAIISRGAFDFMRETSIPVDGGSAAYQRMLGGFAISGIYFLLSQAFKKGNRNTRNLSTPDSYNSGKGPKTSDGKKREQKPSDYLYILGNTLCGPVLGVACYQWALSELAGGVVLAIVATTPLVAIPFTWWLEKDRAGLQAWGGGLIASAGVAGLVMGTEMPGF